MKIIVDVPVRGFGRPKGHSNSKIVIATAPMEFELADSAEGMHRAIEMKSDRMTLEFFQNGDGRTYRKRAQQGIQDGHHFTTRYNANFNPFVELEITAILKETGRYTDQELQQSFFPKSLSGRHRYDSYNLAILDQLTVEWDKDRAPDIQANWEKTAKVVDNFVVSDGQLYEAVPEPCYVVENVGHDHPVIRVRQMIYDPNRFDRATIEDRQILAFFNVSDTERVLQFARDTADDLHGVFNGEIGANYRVTDYSPITSTADEMTLLYVARHMLSVVRNYNMRGDDAGNIERLLRWNEVSLACLRALSERANDRNWMKDVEGLERAVEACMNYDKSSREPLFTHSRTRDVGIDFEQVMQQWAMREITPRGLHR